MIASTAWGVWATDKLLDLDKREVVTVQLGRIMGDFVEAEARSGRPPRKRPGSGSRPISKLSDASVQRLGREGRTVMVAEAVVAGSAPDLTEAVRTDVARRMGALSPCAALATFSRRSRRGFGCGRGSAVRRWRCQPWRGLRAITR